MSITNRLRTGKDVACAFYLLSGNILSVTRDNPFPIKIHATANATVIPAQSNTPVNPVPIFNNLLYF